MKSKFDLLFVALLSFVAGVFVKDYIDCKEYKEMHEAEKLYDDEDYEDFDKI